MEYIAHKDNERVQTVKEHLYGTAELAGFFAERFGKKEWGYCCGMLHDLGKYSKEFQRKIRNDTGERIAKTVLCDNAKYLLGIGRSLRGSVDRNILFFELYCLVAFSILGV